MRLINEQIREEAEISRDNTATFQNILHENSSQYSQNSSLMLKADDIVRIKNPLRTSMS